MTWKERRVKHMKVDLYGGISSVIPGFSCRESGRCFCVLCCYCQVSMLRFQSSVF